MLDHSHERGRISLSPSCCVKEGKYGKDMTTEEMEADYPIEVYVKVKNKRNRRRETRRRQNNKDKIDG
jgi:hypothetical protein